MLPFEARIELTRVKNLLAETDTSVIYGMEEMFLLLIETKVIDVNLINPHVLKKIENRKVLRARLAELNALIQNDKQN